MADSNAPDLLLSELGRLSARINEAERKLTSGPPPQKVEAAGDLAELRQRAASIEERLHQIRQNGPAGENDVKTGIELELRDLADAFERWVDR